MDTMSIRETAQLFLELLESAGTRSIRYSNLVRANLNGCRLNKSRNDDILLLCISFGWIGSEFSHVCGERVLQLTDTGQFQLDHMRDENEAKGQERSITDGNRKPTAKERNSRAQYRTAYRLIRLIRDGYNTYEDHASYLQHLISLDTYIVSCAIKSYNDRWMPQQQTDVFERQWHTIPF